MDNSESTERGRPRITEMGTMTMTPLMQTSNMNSVVLPPLNEILGDIYNRPPPPRSEYARFHLSPSMPRRYLNLTDRGPFLPSHQSPLGASSSERGASTGMTTTAPLLTPLAPPAPKKRKQLHSPPSIPMTLVRPAKRATGELVEREQPSTSMGIGYPSYGPSYPYSSGAGERDHRRLSTISTTSHPEISLPPVSTFSQSRASSSESERPGNNPLPSLYHYSHSRSAPAPLQPPPLPPTHHSQPPRHMYEADGPSSLASLPLPSYGPYSQNYRYSTDHPQPYHPPSPSQHSLYNTPSHHHTSLSQLPYSHRTGYGSRSSQPPPPPPPPTAALDRSPFPSSAHHHHRMESGMDQFDPTARLGTKRRRGNLPKPVTDMLRAWLSSHVAHPYPTEEEKIQLCDATNLTMNQISNWFINARRRRLNQRSDDPAQPRRPSPPRQNPSVGHGHTPPMGHTHTPPMGHHTPPMGHHHTPPMGHHHTPPTGYESTPARHQRTPPMVHTHARTHSHEVHGLLPPPPMPQQPPGPYGPPGR